MKFRTILLALLLVSLASIGLVVVVHRSQRMNQQPAVAADSAIGQQLKGTHLLRQVKTFTSVDGHLSEGFFLLAAGADGSEAPNPKITFAWQGNDNVYRFTTLPLRKVRVQTDPGAGLPYIRFCWESGSGSELEPYIRYVLIYVNPRDFPIEINTPLSAKK